MAETASKLPEEDQSDIRPHDIPELRDREQNAGSTSSAGSRSFNSGSTGAQSSGNTSTAGGGSANDGGEDPEQGLYKGDDGSWRGVLSPLRDKNGKQRFGFTKRNKIIFTAISVFVSLCVGLSAFFFSGIFNLPNFMKNIEQAGFQRYQVDLQGRSRSWLIAYMQLRFGEVDDPNLAPKDRDNLFFRVERVQSDKPLVNWYRALRNKTLPGTKTSAFEQSLFEKYGIRFTSIAYRDGDSIKYRAGTISFKDTDTRITFDPGQKTFDAIARGDPNAFNGVLNDFAQIDEKFDSDKDARTALKAMLRQEYPGIWKAAKRYHVRQDIQSMIGTRDWTFFEKTQTKVRESKISMRNKVIKQAFPGDGNVSNFVKCLFGVPDCKASNDPANPDAQDHGPTGTQKEGDKTDGDPKNPQRVGDGTGEPTLTDAVGTDAASAAGDTAGKILSKLVAKAGILSLLDSLARFDQALHDHKLSKIVAQTKEHWYVGAFTAFAVAADNLTTGQQTSSQVNAFMQQFKYPTNNEGWTTVIDPENNSNKAAAATTDYVKAKNKAEFCSEEHQAEMAAHPEQADKEYQYSCPQNKIGGPNNAKELEDAWDNGPGVALHPVLKTYHAATGGIFDVFNSVTSAITDPIVTEALKATGTKDDVEHLTAAAGAKALEYGGAVSPINNKTPSGQMSMTVLQGGAAMAEASMRDQGGIPTTPESRQASQKAVIAYQADQQQTSFFNRYLSPSNPRSLFATEFFAITTSGFGNIGRNLLTVFGNAISSPLKVLLQPVHAAVSDGYAAARFAGIDTNDMPPQCLNRPGLQMTPQNSTNGDELGYFKPDELNWDLMSNKDDWHKALYEKVGGDEDKALQVYNCALIDNTARGSMSAPAGYAGEGAYKSQGGDGDGEDDTGPSATVSGDIQQIAQDILANKNVTYQFSAQDDMKLFAQGKNGTNGAPVDIRLLQIVAALAQKHKVDISAVESYGQGHSAGSDHYSGHALDIANIDGIYAYKNITDFYSEFSQYAKGIGFLQGNCPGAKQAPPGMDRQPGDTCNHQHMFVTGSAE